MSRAVKFLYLTQEQVIECGGLDMVQTIEAVEKAFSLLDAGECIEPLSLRILRDEHEEVQMYTEPGGAIYIEDFGAFA